MKKIIILLLISLLNINANAQKETSPEPEFKEIYFTNKHGERITGSVNVAEKIVYMVIVSTNAIGETAVIKMDKDENYFYKKKFLGEGDSIKILIEKDVQKVKLVIYNSNNKKHVKWRTGEKQKSNKAKDAKQNKNLKVINNQKNNFRRFTIIKKYFYFNKYNITKRKIRNF